MTENFSNKYKLVIIFAHALPPVPYNTPFIALQSVGVAWGQEEGLASYYHERFHGRKSSSGRVHDKDELVAAHRTYPFGTFLRITNLDNMKSVIVCVTDRGPHRKGRIIDVSASAAQLLGFKKKELPVSVWKRFLVRSICVI